MRSCSSRMLGSNVGGWLGHRAGIRITVKTIHVAKVLKHVPKIERAKTQSRIVRVRLDLLVLDAVVHGGGWRVSLSRNLPLTYLR